MDACEHVCRHTRIYTDMPATSTQYLSIFAELGILEVLKVQVINAAETMGEVITDHHLLAGIVHSHLVFYHHILTMRKVKRLVHHQHLLVHLPDHLLPGTAVLLEIILQDGDCVMQLDTPIARQRRMEGHDFAREVRASRANVLATTPAFRVP